MRPVDGSMPCVTDRYHMASTPGTIVRIAPGPSRDYGEGPPSWVPDHLPTRTDRSVSTLSTNELATRVWRIAVTIGPLVAIALSLAAGAKWR